MNDLETQLLHAQTGGREPRLCIRSSTRIDTGRWWRPTPVWLCVTDNELLMLAVARRQYVARAALRDIAASRYQHATGELVIEPGETLPLNRFKLSLADALSILNFINPTQPTSC